MRFQSPISLSLLFRADCLICQSPFSSRYPMSSQPLLSFSSHWDVLGPFQTGTREATWGADPLEQFGGFRNLSYDTVATFVSSLPDSAVVKWTRSTAKDALAEDLAAETDLHVRFESTNWTALRSIYGWAATQYQAWARGEIHVKGVHPLDEKDSTKARVLLYVDSVLELYVDDQHFFGGDLYAFRKAPILLELSPGTHRLDVRLVREVRAMGDAIVPDISIRMRAELPEPGLHLAASSFPDLVEGHLSSPFASLTVRNDGIGPIEVGNVTEAGSDGSLTVSALGLPKTIQPGQTRSIALRLECTSKCPGKVKIQMELFAATPSEMQRKDIATVHFNKRSIRDVFRLTYLQPSGTVGYAMLRAPPPGCKTKNGQLPILVDLHGAGLEASSPEQTDSLSGAGNLCAFVLFPSGGSAWSNDDWHQSGSTHVLSAIHAVASWAKSDSWKGPMPNMSKWFMVGHSNGGQGTYYMLTHYSEFAMAAAVVAGYSSIQNYVPYHFWHPMDPAIQGLLEGALLDYRHELLLENAKGVTLLQQHGNADGNVPVYHSKLMRQLAVEAKLNATFHEIPGADHWFDGIMTTSALKDFYQRVLDYSIMPEPLSYPVTIVSARPRDTHFTKGLRINSLTVPGRLGRLTVANDGNDGDCVVRTTNVDSFSIKRGTLLCKRLRIGSTSCHVPEDARDGYTYNLVDGEWQVQEDPLHIGASPGGMDAVLRASEPFSVIAKENHDTAMQVSRNLYQYFELDAAISDHVLPGTTPIMLCVGQRISIPFKGTTPASPKTEGHSVHAAEEPMRLMKAEVEIVDSDGQRHVYNNEGGSIGAIFLTEPSKPRGSPGLFIWGSDAEGLRMAARLLPMLPGVGQPDFIVVSHASMVKGAAGSLAMGFFTARAGHYAVSSHAYFT